MVRLRCERSIHDRDKESEIGTKLKLQRDLFSFLFCTPAPIDPSPRSSVNHLNEQESEGKKRPSEKERDVHSLGVISGNFFHLPSTDQIAELPFAFVR